MDGTSQYHHHPVFTRWVWPFCNYIKRGLGSRVQLPLAQRVSVTFKAQAIEDFHVTSYQANFASHPTRDHHVGFLLHGRV